MARISRKAKAMPVQILPEQIWDTCIYGRLSFEDDRKKESDSIGNQIAMLEHYIGERPDLKLISVFKDVNQTGTNFQRSGFKEMMEAIKCGKINCIVVKDLSRFGRNYIEAGTYLEKILPFLNVRFISVNDNYDSLHPAVQDEEYGIPLKNLIHDMYARDISQKIKAGLAVKRGKGEFTGGIAPYGYLKGDGGKLLIDEQIAPIVRDLFQWAKDGMSVSCIAQKLNEAGISSPSQYRYTKGILKSERYAEVRYWYKNTVRRILSNPVYLGHMVQGKTTSDLWGNGGGIDIPQEQWVEIKNTHEPLVDEETFLAVRQIKQERWQCSKDKIVPQGSNLLKGRVFCGDCKRSMKRRKISKAEGTAGYSFTCATYEDICRHDCKKKRIEESELRDLLYTAIYKQLELAVDMEGMILTLQTEGRVSQQERELDHEIYETKKKLSKLAVLRSSLYADYQQKRLDEKDYLLIKSKYGHDVSVLSRRLDVLSRQKCRADSESASKVPWLAGIKKWDQNNLMTEKIISELIERIELFSDQAVSICFNYRDELEDLLQPNETKG
ncbi:recombinase family protein [Aminipila butyrica]|uniref:Recombinase family protein n=1 Tax=Aminipila butyrica TaxID=433296 RepID=A0A858BZS3_9FIRM|nr:recombinase family protein [Aminipila butyrica]QIB69606.1 recombinase family protein [Aminipila butyrica]